MHRGRRLPHAFIVDRGIAEPDVVGNRAGKQMDVLEHQTEEAANVSHIELADVDAVNADPAALDVVEPQQQIDERRLARAGGTDDTETLARLAPRTTRP